MAGKFGSPILLLPHRTLSAESSSLALNGVECFAASWNDSLLQLIPFMPSKSVMIL